MKKITTLIFTILIAYNSYCQTFNDYSNPQSLFSLNVVPDWSVKEVQYSMELPKPIYDENTSYGRCMNNYLRACLSKIDCTATYLFFQYYYWVGWHRSCVTSQSQAIIPHIKTL